MVATKATKPAGIKKARTGIEGFDDVTYGGLPEGRPTLVCGSAGSGKTLFAVEFLVKGATLFGEPGVFVTFEETSEDLSANVASLGFDLTDLVARDLLRIDHIHVDRAEIEESGNYDLEGLFIRLGYAIDQIGAKRVVLDTMEAIFANFDNQAILRSEVKRLFDWLKQREVTAVVTGERGEGQLTRQGLEEYVSDCVILLDNRVQNQVTTRRLRVVKYRGSTHGTNEYPFLIDRDGFSVLPVTSMSLKHGTSLERVSTGVASLDEMLGGEGFYRGSSILITGTSGTGKSSLAASFADAACRRGERCLYFAFEESAPQLVRNMKSIAVDLQPWLEKGLLEIHATRPMHFGLEMHLATMQRIIARENPSVLVVDPISNLQSVGDNLDISSMLIRLVDFLKARGVSAEFVSLSNPGSLETTESGLSSVMDTWILLRDIELNGERNRALYVLKSRGMPHSNQIREFLIDDAGIHLREAYLGPGGVLTGSARVSQEEIDRRALEADRLDAARRMAAFERKKRALEAQVLALQAEIELESIAIQEEKGLEHARTQGEASLRERVAQSRRVRPREEMP